MTLAKKGGLANRRLAHARLLDDTQLKKLFAVLAERYKDRNGCYTRVIKAGIRASDASPMAVIAFVDRDVDRSAAHTSALQSLMRTSYAVSCFQQQIIHTILSRT